MERVHNEVDPESESLPVGVHGQALEVALGASPAGDRVTNDVGVTNDTKTGGGRSVDRFIQPVAVELPERLEGLPVDVKDRINVAAMTSAEPSGPGGRSGSGPRRSWLKRCRASCSVKPSAASMSRSEGPTAAVTTERKPSARRCARMRWRVEG